jgi:N-acyl-D-amino-acid deacylase
MYASTQELLELVLVMKAFPGTFYAPHHRSYGQGALDGYLEMLSIASQSNVPVRAFLNLNLHMSRLVSRIG